MKAITGSIQETTATKINDLHNNLLDLMHRGIETAVQIGELLSQKKAELPHGKFGPWVKENLVFTGRTARRYIMLFENKEKILQAGSITEAYKMLEAPKTDTVSDLELTDNEMRLCSMLDGMEVGEAVTGFTHGYGKAITDITIQKQPDDKFNYYISLLDGTDPDYKFTMISPKDSISIVMLLEYLRLRARYDDLPIQNITWVYPGINIEREIKEKL